MQVDKKENNDDGVERIYTEDLRKGKFPPRFKGRGATDSMDIDSDERYSGKGGIFEQLTNDHPGGDQSDGAPLRSIEGWIIIVSNIQEEVQEPDLLDIFSEYGQVKNVHLNIDRRTGFTKGYALLEYENKSEAEEAIKNGTGHELAGNKLSVDWAFITSSSTPSISTSIKTNRHQNKNRDRDSGKEFIGGGNKNRTYSPRKRRY
eukprot:gene5978-7449_t